VNRSTVACAIVSRAGVRQYPRKVEAALPDEGLVGMLVEPERPEDPVQYTHRPAEIDELIFHRFFPCASVLNSKTMAPVNRNSSSARGAHMMVRRSTAFLMGLAMAGVRWACRPSARPRALRFRTRINHGRRAVGVVSSVLALGLVACGSKGTPTAPATVASVAVTGTAPGVGASAPFSATAMLSDGTTQIVTSQATWASSNTSVATVSAGTVSGLAPGESDITATYQNASGRVHVTIVSAVMPTYTITGTVTDGTSGGVLPNIDIQASDSAGKTLSTKTGSSGTYTIGGLAAGLVAVTAAATSYQSATQTVALSSDLRVDIVLRRVTCAFSVTPATFSFSSAGGEGIVTVVSQAPGCTWTASSSHSFLTITSASTGLDNGNVSFSVAPNPAPSSPTEPPGVARSGTLTIAGTTVTVSQEAPRDRFAVYDATFKAPVCQDVAEGCRSVTSSAGPGETNQPNTIFSACPDGSALASIEVIVVATPDGTPLAAGKAARITVVIRPAGTPPHVYIAADAQRPSWTEVAVAGRSNTLISYTTVLPAGAGLQAIRASYSGENIVPGPGPCAGGTNFDNDDLVFRVQ
jgi:hypothetical protein